MRFLILSAVIFSLFSCRQEPAELKSGFWRGVITLQEKELPFTFDVQRNGDSYLVYLHNSSEKILLDEISIQGDSVVMVMHIFDAELRAKVDGDRLQGTFFKNYAPETSLPFVATFGEHHRFTKNTELAAEQNFAGKYQIEFTTTKDKYPSVAIIEQNGNDLTGTFLTPLGDYRYLEGSVINGQLMLSTFDGNHAFLFVASLSGDSIQGDFYSGETTHETFAGVKNEDAKMPDPESLTFLKDGYDKIEFSFPDLQGNLVSSSDKRFNNQVVILQIFGTWCPNCMDETRFLSHWYINNHHRGVEILGLAYERKSDFAYAVNRVNKMKEKLKVPYDFVIAGHEDKLEAAKTLPMLNKVIAFPTTIIIGRDGKVKHIYTGFEGPGTGVYYQKFKDRFNQHVNELLNEKLTSSR